MNVPCAVKFAALALDITPILLCHLRYRRLKRSFKALVDLVTHGPFAIAADHVVNQLTGSLKAASLKLRLNPFLEGRGERNVHA